MRLLTTALIAWPLLLGLVACGSKSTPAVDAQDPCASGTTPAELMPCVEESRLVADIATVAQERLPGSAHWLTVQELCRSRLLEFGYEVELQDYGTGINVIGRLEGRDPAGGDVIVSAHYDSIGEGCPAAGDNAAGVAAVLEIARVLAAKPFSNSLVLACWDEEETGLVGSRAYADAATAAGTEVVGMISFDTLGFYSSEPNSQTLPSGFGSLFPDAEAAVVNNESRADFVSLIADVRASAASEIYVGHAESIGLRAIPAVVPENLKFNLATQELRRSDHASFWAHDFPGLLLSDSANFRNPNYHCTSGMDTPETLNMSFVTQIAQAALGTSMDLLLPATSE